MPPLTLELDQDGKPVIELHVGATLPFREAAGNTSPSQAYVLALIDTGASQTHVERRLLEQLGLDPVGTTVVHSVTSGGTPAPAQVFAVDLALAGEQTGILATDLAVVAAKDLRRLQVQALLGRDVLNRCHLHYDGPGLKFTLTY